jgi:hypothetical protein
MLNDKLVGRPTRLNKKTLAIRKANYAELMLIGDLHYGSPQCDVPRFLAQIDYCLQKKLYVLLMGDLIELATRHSIGAGVYEQEVPGQSQVEWVIEKLTPLAKAGLIVGSHTGN